jgi:hypothetical protein
MTRMLSKAVGAFIILGLLSPNMALADPTTVAAAPVAPAASTASASDVAQAGPLSDVPLNSWAYDAVDQLAKDGIIKGYPDGTFKGNRPMTRYEAAVLAYRAVDMIEAQITAGKAVEKADIDAANKLIAAFGAELKTVERHVDALQKQADATQSEADQTKNALSATDKRLTGQVGALNDFTKRAYIKFNDIFREFAYGGNFNYNCGPGTYAPGAAGSISSYCANTGGGNALLPGARVAGYGPSLGNTPPGLTFPNGQRNQGQYFNYTKISFTGTPSDNTSFLMEMSTSNRPATSTGTSTTTAYCIPQQNFLNGNAAQTIVSGTACTVAVASQAPYADGETGFLAGINNLWYQISIPTSGLYLRLGHVQVNEGPAGGSWLGGDYFWGAFLGITNGPLNAYVGYGVGNAAVTNNTLDNIPTSVQKFVIEADYSFNIGKGLFNVGGMYMNYTGDNSNMWDPSAVLCTGAGGTNRIFANTAAVPFTTCGVGFAPLTFSNGAPITGAYLSAANNNPTVSGTAAAPSSFITPGLVVNNPISWVGAHGIVQYGKARVYVAGTMHLGNDPYTGTTWKANLSGEFLADYGPFRVAPGNRGKWTYELQGFANQFNSLTANNNYFGGPSLYNSWNTNPSGLFWASANVKYWESDTSYIALGYGHYGLLPNTVIPAGGVTCPGCVVTGFNQNAGYLEFNINF